MSIYLKADGVQGNVSTQGFENWVKVQSFRFGGISQRITQKTGKIQDRIQGVPNFNFIVLKKTADMTTPTWFGYAHSSTVLPNIELSFTTTGSHPFTYQQIKLTNAFVSHFDQEHHEGEHHPIETLVLAYETLKVTYTPRKADNTPATPVMAGYDLSAAIKL